MNDEAMKAWDRRVALAEELMRQEWFSICSMHRQVDPDCDMCKRGVWSSRAEPAGTIRASGDVNDEPPL